MNNSAHTQELAHSGTAAALVRAALALFTEHGYDGTSVRAITRRAGANLGAITYHFGSKQGLYDAVIAQASGPFREQLSAAADGEGSPLDRLQQVVRAFFGHLYENPDLPRLMMQQLTGSRPIPEVTLRTMQTNIGIIASLIRQGQADGSIRDGDPRFMALSIGSQPIWLTVAQRGLREGVGIDQDDPETRARLVESIVRFVRAGLAAHPERAE
jgi:TetR/AcrR family transcriptional regulator